MRKMYLTGRAGTYAGQTIPLEGEIVLGRDAKVCQLVYPDNAKRISGTHCKLRVINDKLCLIDMNSTNGTFFQDGIRLEPNSPRLLEDGQGFYLGSRNESFDVKIEEIPEVVETPKKNRESSWNWKPVVGVAAALLAIIIITKAIDMKRQYDELERDYMYKELENWELERAYEEEANKGTIEKTIDAVDSWLDVLK